MTTKSFKMVSMLNKRKSGEICKFAQDVFYYIVQTFCIWLRIVDFIMAIVKVIDVPPLASCFCFLGFFLFLFIKPNSIK